MLEFALSGMRSGIRGRSFHGVFLIGLVVIALAYLSGHFSPRQPRTVAMDVGLSGLRFSLVLLNLFWVLELVAREIDRRTILFSLTYPVSRAEYLLGRFLAIAALSFLATAALGMLLGISVVVAGPQYEQEFPVSLALPYWISLFGFWLDALVVASFALLISSLSTVALLPLALGGAFAIGGKALGATLDYLSRGADGDEVMVSQFSPVLSIVRLVLPDLSRLDWREWPLYGLVPSADSFVLSVLMATFYVLIMVLAAGWVLSRREFS